MDQYYTITQLARMSMLTDRTLRTYLKHGLLHGEKTASSWRFSQEDITAFLQIPSVQRAMEVRQLAVVEDFLHQRMNTSGQSFFIWDKPVEQAQEADAICTYVLQAVGDLDLRMVYRFENGMVRITLRGPSETVLAAAQKIQRFEPSSLCKSRSFSNCYFENGILQ